MSIRDWEREKTFNYEQIAELVRGVTPDPVIYLASPYSKYPHGLDAAHAEICIIAGKLFALDLDLYCPIAHNHHIAKASGLAVGFSRWGKYDKVMLRRCDVLVVATMESWEVSDGITGEIKYAEEIIKPCYLLEVEKAVTPLVKSSNRCINTGNLYDCGHHHKDFDEAQLCPTWVNADEITRKYLEGRQ